MAKTEIYSWRLDPKIKMALETEARSEKMTLAALLDRMAEEWLEAKKQRNGDDEAEQARLHSVASKCFGTIAAGPDFSQNVSAQMRTLLRERHARKRSA
jgi:hypothetical protein